MTLDLWNNWIVMGFTGAALWGLSCAIDVCFVKGRVYRRPVEGPVVAGLFCVGPMVGVDGMQNALDVDAGVLAVACVAALCYLLHVYFYFSALFALNDASNAEIFNCLSILIVPVLAFFFLGEILSPQHYLAMGLSVIGIGVLIRLQGPRLTPPIVLRLAISVISASLMMVLQAWVLRNVGYEAGLWLFSAASFGAVSFLLALSGDVRRGLLRVGLRFGPLLVAVQVLELGAVLGSQRATETAPSVSSVALIESSLPLFVMAFSGVLVFLGRAGWRTIGRGVREALEAQTTAGTAKLLSLALIIAAIYLANP